MLHVHPPGKVSATSVWHLNPTGTPRIREVKEVSAKVSKSYWYAACQTMFFSAVFSSFMCRPYWYAAYQAVDFFVMCFTCRSYWYAACQAVLVSVDVCLLLRANPIGTPHVKQ